MSATIIVTCDKCNTRDIMRETMDEMNVALEYQGWLMKGNGTIHICPGCRKKGEWLNGKQF
jgi:hypothetical protein